MFYPDINEDIFISTKEVGFLIDGLPSLSFSDGKMYSQSFFHYNTDLYQKSSGKKYYVFRDYEDCTLFIMNCNKEIYKELYTQIELDDSIPIFINHTNQGKEKYICIPFDYRKESGFGGTVTITIGSN